MHDVIVVGGGIVGSSAAYHLARSGASTLLVDRRDAGRATDAGAGIITPGGDPESSDPWNRICGAAELFYRELISGLDRAGVGSAGYEVCGSLVVAVSSRDQRAFQEISAGLRPEAKALTRDEAVVVSGDRARELFPPLGHVEGAVFEPTGARVDGRQLADAMTDGAAAHGTEVVCGSVTDVDVSGGRVTSVQVDGVERRAGHVVIAGGAWSEALGNRLETSIPVAPQRGQIVHLDMGDVSTQGWTIVSGMRHHYIVPWDDNRVVVGATRESGVGFSPNTTVAGIHEVLDEAIRVAPGLRSASIKEIRVGLRPSSADGFPVIGPLPRVQNAFVVTGHGPMGLHLGPYSGKLIAEQITDGGVDNVLAAFNVDRFT